MNTIPPNKIIVADLDGTLAESKAPVTPGMAEALGKLLRHQKFAVISGGSYRQFQKQFLGSLSGTSQEFANLSLFPVNGATCYIYDIETGGWKQLYDEAFTEDERKHIIEVLRETIKESGVEIGETFGELIEDRGEQVTFSGCGQEAPLAVKERWDPDQKKRKKIVELLIPKLGDASVSIGGATSIDITHKGVNKAYAIEKIKSIFGFTTKDIVFLGDALYPHGNDAPAKETGVVCIEVKGPEDTEKFIRQYVDNI